MADCIAVTVLGNICVLHTRLEHTRVTGQPVVTELRVFV
jgi:hypothetical protein